MDYEEWKRRAERAEEELEQCEAMLQTAQGQIVAIRARLDEWRRWLHTGGYEHGDES